MSVDLVGCIIRNVLWADQIVISPLQIKPRAFKPSKYDFGEGLSCTIVSGPLAGKDAVSRFRSETLKIKGVPIGLCFLRIEHLESTQITVEIDGKTIVYKFELVEDKLDPATPPFGDLHHLIVCPEEDDLCPAKEAQKWLAHVATEFGYAVHPSEPIEG